MQKTDSKTPLPLIIGALAFAARKHRFQRRKDADASPYINHPIAVASILVVEAAIDDPEVVCAALLHDTVEDTKTTTEELVENFGPAIAGIVAEVTDDKSLPKQERKRRQITHAPKLSAKAQQVKFADKIANLRDVVDAPPANWSLARKQEYFDWAKDVVDALPARNPKLRALFEHMYARRP